MPVPPNFHGKKGRSGRKCVRDEQLRIRVIEKAWKKKEKIMSNQDATQIVVKDMTEKKDVTSGGKPININFDSAFKNDSSSKAT